VFASSSVLLFSSHPGRLQAETPLNALCRLAEPPLSTPKASSKLAADVTDRLWSYDDIIAKIDAAKVPAKRGLYKPRISK